MRRAALAPAWALVITALCGCSSCPSPMSTASARADTVTLDATTPEVAFEISVHAPEQECGCTWCGDPTLSLTFSGDLDWTSPPGASALPIVRVTLKPKFEPSPQDTLDPPLPVDVVLTPEAHAKQPVLAATHLCPDDDECDLGYTLTLSRVEPAPLGPITASWSIDAQFVSKPDGSLGVSVTR